MSNSRAKYNFGFDNPTNFFKSMHFIDVGYHDHTKVKAFSTKPRVQFYHTFHIVLEGEGTLKYANNTYKLTPNTIFYLPAHSKFLYLPSKKNPYKFVWIGFDGEEIINYLNNSLNINKDTPILHPKDAEKNAEFIKEFLNSNTQKNITEGKLLSFFFSFLDNIAPPSIDDKKQPSTSVRIARIKEIIKNNYMNPRLDIKTISNIMHVSHSWLCALFKKETNTTMQQYLIKIRLKHAANLLMENKLSVNEIAYLCGFNDALYFSAKFKQHYTLSPVNYRKKYINYNQ